MAEPHLSETELERYSMGRASEEEAALWEEHLLTCEPCRRRVAGTDAYIRAMQRAAREIRRREPE